MPWRGKVLNLSTENAHLPFPLLAAFLSIDLVLAAGNIGLVWFCFTILYLVLHTGSRCLRNRDHTMHTQLSKYNCHVLSRAYRFLNILKHWISYLREAQCFLSNNEFMYNLKLEQPVCHFCFINLRTYCTAVLHAVLQKLFLYCFLILDSLWNLSLSWSDFYHVPLNCVRASVQQIKYYIFSSFFLRTKPQWFLSLMGTLTRWQAAQSQFPLFTLSVAY